MRLEVGQKIWIGEFRALSPVYETCPDCGGTGRLRVTFHDETQVSIECRNCAAGYDPPTGRVTVYRNQINPRLATVCGFENAHGKTRWHVDGTEGGYRIVEDADAFEDEKNAAAWAKAREGKYEQEQRAKILTKEKDTRTWAWNASYHRKMIKDAQEKIDYHKSKLSVAVVRAEEPTHE